MIILNKKEDDFVLSISLYVDTLDEELIDIAEVQKSNADIEIILI